MKRIACLTLLAACSFNPTDPARGGDGGPGDAPAVDGDVTATGSHVLITEVAAIGSGGQAEFIEIFNPTGQTVDLSTYYLSDDRNYWRLPGHPASQTITLFNSDFLVKFPNGTMMPPGRVFVIAVQGPTFAQVYPNAPLDFTIVADQAPAVAMEVAVSPPGGDPERLTNTGEMLVLFEWDGQRDVVRDVDLVVQGRTTDPSNLPIAREAVDGPDADTTPTSYQPDALTFTQVSRDMVDDESYKRIARESDEGTGGNGITGHDETSETLSTTWEVSLAPTPGVVPAAL